MDTPYISVVVPVYNVERYIKQCVDSILSQSYNNFELLLIDDGSNDNSGRICDNYVEAESRVRVIHQSNSGVSCARNRGIIEARGEWIVFVDSDDFVDSDYLENFKIQSDEADIILQGLEYYDNHTEHYFNPFNFPDCFINDNNLKHIVIETNLLHCGYPFAKAFKRSLLENIRFRIDISFHEDHIFVLEALNAANNIKLVNSIAYKYRCFHSNTTLSQKRHSWYMLNAAADEMIKKLDVMSKRFLYKDSVYYRNIYSFAYYPKIEAVFELFRAGLERNLRRKNYHSIIRKSELREKYYPTQLKFRILKQFILVLPYFLSDIFLRITIKYQNRKTL